MPPQKTIRSVANEPDIKFLKAAERRYPLGGTLPSFTFTIGPDVDPNFKIYVLLANQKNGDWPLKSTQYRYGLLETRLWKTGSWFHTLEIYKIHYIGPRNPNLKALPAYNTGNHTPVSSGRSGRAGNRALSRHKALPVDSEESTWEEDDTSTGSADPEIFATAASHRTKRTHENTSSTDLEEVSGENFPTATQSKRAPKRRRQIKTESHHPDATDSPGSITGAQLPPSVGSHQPYSDDDIESQIQKKDLEAQYQQALARGFKAQMEKADLAAKLRAQSRARQDPAAL
ncbi:MAG: hypothetical protein L6R38_005149 [Xanthoria sp. 2 TBL-2021]|nr:MAG: hypothetical protein L6R38_005149 [Xanthoria sp. 2 TBL-2021]